MASVCGKDQVLRVVLAEKNAAVFVAGEVLGGRQGLWLRIRLEVVVLAVWRLEAVVAAGARSPMTW